MNPATDIKGILEDDSSLGLTFATNLFVGEMPDDPDLCVAVYDSGGDDPLHSLSTDNEATIFQPAVQVRIRGTRNGYIDAQDLGFAVRDVLNGYTNLAVTNARYLAIWQTTDLQFIARDDKQRPIFTINFRTQVAYE